MRPSHRLKLDHAVEHFYALEAASERWSQTDPCVAWSDCEIETRKHRTYVEVISQPDDPLIHLRLADCVHNMRQALDHIAYQLAVVVARADPPPNEETTGFPIITPRQGETRAKTVQRFANGLAAKIGCRKAMPAGMYAVLEGLQPYNGGDPYLLEILNDLDNLDKHRFPPIVAGVVKGDRFETSTAAFTHLAAQHGGAFEPDTPSA